MLSSVWHFFLSIYIYIYIYIYMHICLCIYACVRVLVDAIHMSDSNLCVAILG